MDYTGERYDPGDGNALAFYDHYARYHFVRNAFGDPRRRLLDFGCGLGVGTRFMAPAFQAAIGVDPSADAISRAKALTPVDSVEFYTSSEFSERQEGGFDVATCLEVIEHTHEQQALVEFVHSKLSKSGIAVFSTPNILHTRAHGIRNPFHVRELRREEFQDLLTHVFRYVSISDAIQVNGMGIVASAKGNEDIRIYASPGHSIEEAPDPGCVADFVAVCSDEPLLPPKGLLLLDPRSTYVKQLEAIVESQARLVDERDTLLANQDRLIADRDKALRAQVQLIDDRDRAIVSQTKLIDERDAFIREQALAVEALETKLRSLRNPAAALRWMLRL